MNWLEILAALSNLVGSILLGLDLLQAPSRLRHEVGLEKLQRFVAEELEEKDVFVLVAGKKAPLSNALSVRAFAIKKRGQLGFLLLVLGFTLQLAGALFGGGHGVPVTSAVTNPSR